MRRTTSSLTLRPCLLLLLALCSPLTARAEVVTSNGVTACTVRTSHYQLRVDTASPGLIAVDAADGKVLWRGISQLVVTLGGRGFTSNGAPAPHLHTLRAGPHLAELSVEGIALTAQGETWPGLAELHVTCCERKLYLHFRCILPQGDWINAGRYVYRRPAGHPQAVACSPEEAHLAVRTGSKAEKLGYGAVMGDRPCMIVAGTMPGSRTEIPADAEGLLLSLPVGDTPWTPGAVREAAWAFLIAPDREQAAAALDTETHPLPAEAFNTRMGQCDGLDARTGLYVFRAQTSPTPDPPRGLRAGTAFTVTNDARQRELVVDSFDPWGGICGGILRGGDGTPLPIRLQFALNFPELHGEAGEPGWAALTFPLTLEPHSRREIQVEHLYGGAREHDLLFLTSLENVGDPLLMQATVSRIETFTVTTGLSPGEMKPGNELRVNDFRRHYRDLKVRSVSAVLPTFFGYYDADDRYQGLVPGEVRIAEAGPLLAEMSIAARTGDGRVAGSVHIWEVPCSDLTRVFTDVSLRVLNEVRLSPRRPAPVFFLRHHAFNPMAYRRFAAWVRPGKALAGDLGFVPQVAANGTPLADHPFGALYHASNAIDQGIPCSDIVGNPGWVLLDFEVSLDGVCAPPGLYVFATGANDAENGDYARDLAVVPARRPEVLPAGATIRYRAMHVVYGDDGSDYTALLAERRAWAVNPLRVEARVGEVISASPPQVRAADDVAEFSLTGGADWMGVRVGGFRRAGRLEVQRIAADGTMSALPHAREGEPWYIAWPDKDGGFGYTFLVRLPGGGAPLRLRASLAGPL